MGARIYRGRFTAAAGADRSYTLRAEANGQMLCLYARLAIIH